MTLQKASADFPKKALFLLPLLPVLFFFTHSVARFTDLVFTPGVLLLFFIYCLAASFLCGILKAALKFSFSVSVCGSTLLITGFLFFGTIQDTLFRAKKLHFLSNSFLLLFMIFFSVGFVLFLARRKKYSLNRLNHYLLLLFALLIFYELIVSGITFLSGKNANKVAGRMTSVVALPLTSGQVPKPDIYYIIFDAYTNLPALQRYWNYNNDVYPYLQSLGFFTADSAFSNYTSTPFSISSIMNLQYLKGAEPYLHSNSSNFLIGRKTYLNNTLFRFLRGEGYEFSIFSQLEDQELLTTFGFLGVEKPVNWLRKLTVERIYLNPWISEKITKFFRGAGKQPGMIRKSMESFRRYNDKAISHLLSDCNKTVRNSSVRPIFHFTHLMLPHDPYQLDENGKFIPYSKPGGGDMNGYLAQIKYSNKLIQQVAKCLLADTTRKKIIVFQGDHGYRHNGNAPVWQQHDALSAFYFYNQNYEGISKKISHVNTFRIIINKFFEGNLPLLKDSLKMSNKHPTDENTGPY